MTIPEISSWELVATVAVFRAAGIRSAKFHGIPPAWVSCAMAGGITPVQTDEESCQLAYDTAYRMTEKPGRLVPEPYVALLARYSGITLDGIQISRPPVFSVPDPREDREIVLCPSVIRPGIGLPWQVWSAVVPMLRMYGRLAVIGRMNGVALPENDIVTDPSEALRLIAGARVIVGNPNEWLWAAAGLKRRMVVLYPDTEPEDRWFHYAGPVRKLMYPGNRVEPAGVTASVRMVLNAL